MKGELLNDWLKDVPSEEPIVVFTRFRHDLAMVKAVFDERGETCAELSGQKNELSAWQSGQMRGLAVQIQAGGVGVDFTRARYCVYYSLGFSLGDYLQSRKRIHRPGQAHNVVYLHLLAEHTIDRQVYKALENRLDVVNSILEGGLT
jgi:SNF2 family DNA or RNA helicase